MDDDQQKVSHTTHYYQQQNTLHALFYLQHDLRILFPATSPDLSHWPSRVSRKMNTLVDRISSRLLPVES
jgi:hypothetical protein